MERQSHPPASAFTSPPTSPNLSRCGLKSIAIEESGIRKIEKHLKADEEEEEITASHLNRIVRGLLNIRALIFLSRRGNNRLRLGFS